MLSFFLQTNKPIMEKKRRARINHCLNELKTLILEAMKKDVSILFRLRIYDQVQTKKEFPHLRHSLQDTYKFLNNNLKWPIN